MDNGDIMRTRIHGGAVYRNLHTQYIMSEMPDAIIHPPKMTWYELYESLISAMLDVIEIRDDMIDRITAMLNDRDEVNFD